MMNHLTIEIGFFTYGIMLTAIPLAYAAGLMVGLNPGKDTKMADETKPDPCPQCAEKSADWMKQYADAKRRGFLIDPGHDAFVCDDCSNQS